jgi:periplasmic divalent cation tolerance protein
MSSETLFVYITAGSVEEADRIGRALVTERLAACANILPGMRSIYWWDGKIEDAAEAVLVLKTAAGNLEALTARVKSQHSYATPCVVALPITGGNRDYLDWIAAESGGAIGKI